MNKETEIDMSKTEQKNNRARIREYIEKYYRENGMLRSILLTEEHRYEEFLSKFADFILSDE